MKELIAVLLPVFGWPLALGMAWIFGELGYRWFRLPRICLYGLVGFALGNSQLGLLTTSYPAASMLAANVAFGLILFEFGYRINLRWYRTNPWIGITGILEAVITFAAIYAATLAYGLPQLSALLLASLAMSTSPAALMCVINEYRSSGQVTERALHMTAVNCVLAVFIFKVIVGFWTFHTSGNVWQAISNSFVLLAASVAIGGAFGIGIPALLRRIGRLTSDATIGFAIGVILLVSIAHAFRLSPVLATLSFGLVARHRRVTLNQAQRNFGALGELLGIVLFVFIASTLEWHRVWIGLPLAILLIAVRLVTKVVVVGSLGHFGGTTWRKGVLTGLAMTPISVFVILLLEQARFLGIDLVDQLAPLAAMTLVLELVGPIVTKRALQLGQESTDMSEK